MRQEPTPIDFHERSRARDHFLEERFAEEFFSFQYIFTEFFIEHLCDVSRVFKGDLQQMLLLALIGQMHLRWERERRRTGTDMPLHTSSDSGISASRLADCSGIPRETVRRKLVQLQASGWVDRGPNGKWKLVFTADGTISRARVDFSGMNRVSISRVASVLARLEDLADRGKALS